MMGRGNNDKPSKARKRFNFQLMALCGLILISILIAWVKAKQQDGASPIEKFRFAVADTAQLTQITIQPNEDDKPIIRLRQEKGSHQWRLNQKYAVDPALIHLVKIILSRVEVQRSVSAMNCQAIRDDLHSRGEKVTLHFSKGDSTVFYAGGNATQTVAYFASQDLGAIYLVGIPGYNTYPAGIFELTAGQWRERTLFASDPRTLQRLAITYADPAKAPLSIEFQKRFLAVKGVNPLDTAALMDYLAPLENFLLNDYLEKGKYPKYDSLLAEKPIARLSLRDIDVNKNVDLTIYPKIEGERFYLLTDSSGQMIVIDHERMDKLLASPHLFSKPSAAE